MELLEEVRVRFPCGYGIEVRMKNLDKRLILKSCPIHGKKCGEHDFGLGKRTNIFPDYDFDIPENRQSRINKALAKKKKR